MSLLSVAPNSLTGMLTIPKLIEPLQIALAMRVPPGAGRGARVRYRPELPVTVMVTSPGCFPHQIVVIHRIINITC